MYKPYEQLTDAEKKLIYEQWQVFMERRKAQLDRAKKQRMALMQMKQYALEHGFNQEEV